MSPSKHWLANQIAYSGWADQRLLIACSGLSPDELDRDLGSSHASVLRTLRHIYYTERVWLKRLRADSLPPLIEIGDQRLFCDSPPEPDLHALRTDWPPVWQGLQQYLDTLPDTELTGELRGIDCSIPRWKLLLHIVNHSTLHRGQVMSLLRQLGKQPPGTDLFEFHLVGHSPA
jgi:uncharacterized damage-inducible protein DinB